MSPAYPTPRQPSGRRGFTLVELLTVIAIVCVLGGIAFPIIGMVNRQANKGRTLVLFSNLAAAFEDYKREYGRYPIFKELSATATPWTTNKDEIDYSFELNDGDAILRRVLTADPKYLAAVKTPGAVNYNRNEHIFLELDESFLLREQREGTSASSINPWIMDGFHNPHIGVIVHTGDNKEIDQGAFATAKPVVDADENGALLPKVIHNVPQNIAFYALVQNLNDDPVNSSWVTNWPYDQYNR